MKPGFLSLLFVAAACGGRAGSAATDAGIGPDASTSDAAAAPDADASPPTGSDASADAATSSPAGPYPVTKSSTTVSGWAVNVFDPQMPSTERAPLVLFKHGFQLATADYATTLGQIASHGYVVVSVDTPASLFNGPTQAQERDGVIASLDWALSTAAPFAAHLDGAHVAALGHSRGGKIAVMVAAKDARVGALLGLDPVNGCGPGASYSTDCPDVTTASFAPSLAIPAGYMGETADSQGTNACAPAAENYATIYAASTAAPWAAAWTFAGAAHMTFTDDGGGLYGAFCAKASGDEPTLRDEIRTLAVAFLDRYLRGDASMDAWLTGSLAPKDAQVVHK
jgi:pimeloyl-ACP methyl ester carboxylesterase